MRSIGYAERAGVGAFGRDPTRFLAALGTTLPFQGRDNKDALPSTP
jgi:hypothetical protein